MNRLLALGFVLICLAGTEVRADEQAPGLYFAQDKAIVPAVSAGHSKRVGKFAVGHNSTLLAAAERHLGSGKITRLPGNWCRDFINLVAREAGLSLRNSSRRAIDSLGLGLRVSEPRLGDLVVMRHHVTIFAGRENGKIIGLGGNQGKRVRYSVYSPRRIIGFVRI